MSSEETVIHVRLLAGELNGIRIAELPFDDLQAILIPRPRLHSAKQYTHRRLAVYLLLEIAEPRVYIGQTDDAWERLNVHNKKVFWKTAIALTSKTEHGLSYSDIKWLEWRAIQMANEIEQDANEGVQCFHVENDNEPDETSIPDSEQGGLRRIFGSLCALVSVLGYPVFEREKHFPVAKPEGVSYGNPLTMTTIKELLAAGELTIEEIAEKVGMSNSTCRTCILYMGKPNSPIGVTRTRKTPDGKYHLQN